MRSVRFLLGGLAIVALAFVPNAAVAQAAYPNGPDGGDGILDGVGGFFDTSRQLDFDFWFSVLDVVLPDILPTWNSGGTPVWSLVAFQSGATFGGADNDGNTIHDDDHLDLLAAVYDGTPSVVAGVPSGNVTAIRNAFDANWAHLQTIELTLIDVRLQASCCFGVVNVDNTRTITTGSTVNIDVIGDVDIPSLWTANELAAGNDEGLLASANPMLEAALLNSISGYMTVAEGTGSNVETHIQSLLLNFLDQFLQTGLEGLLADIGDISSFSVAGDGTITVIVDVDTGLVGVIPATVTVPGYSVTNALNQFSSAFNCTDFTCGTAVAAANNLNGAGNTNVASWNAASGNRQTFMGNEGISNPPIQLEPMPADLLSDIGSTAVLGNSYVVLGGDGSTKTYDWEDVDQITYEDPTALGGTVNTKTYSIANAQPANAGYYGVAVSDNTWDRVSRSLNLTVGNTPPVVTGISIVSDSSIDITFNKSMGAGVTNAANYTVFGSGRGSLNSTPNNVVSQGGTTYRLSWTAGEMLDGGNITVQVNNSVQSASGLTMGTPNSGSCTGCAIGTAPTVESILSSNPGPSKATSLTYTVTFSEPVISVSAGNFTVVTDGTAAGSIGGFTGGGALYNVTVSGISGTGNLRLNLTSTTPVQDSAGNLLAATANGQVSVIDNTPPAVPTGLNLATASDSGSSNSDDITNVTAVTITGAGETGSTVNLSSNIDGPIGTETVVGGAWSVLTPALSEGVHTITATASDSVGNVSAASVALVVTVDLTPPAAPGVPDLAAGSDSGSFLGADSDNVTNNTTLTFTGTRVAGTRIELRSLVDGVLAPTDGGAGTSYSITPGSSFTEASHPVSARAYDVAGNPSAWSSALTVTVDLTPPSVVSQDPLAGSQVAVLPDYDVTFDGAMAPITAGLFSVDGSAATGVSGSGAGPYTFTGFATPADGTGIPVVFAAGLEDRAGNVSAGESWTINRDSSAPSISWSSGDVTSGGVTNSDITLTATFTEDVTGLLDTEISVTNGSVSNFSGSGDTYTFDVSATGDGLVTVVIPAGVADAVAAPLGRVNAASPAFTYTSDTTGPAVVSITPETGGPTNQSTISFTVIWDGPVTGFTDPGDVTVVHIGTSDTGATITPVSATEYNVEVTGVSGEGIMRLRTVAAAAQDPAGNDSPQSPLLASGFVSIDSIAPVITVDTLTTTDNRPELTGTVNDTGATVSITVSGQVRPAVVTGSSPNGVWTLADDALLALPDGVYNVSASATDFVGNTGTDGTIAELTIDATAPVVTLNGDLIVNVSCGDGYVEEGFTATDNLDGDVSGDVVVSGAGSIPVTTPPGTYVIEYTVTDSLGNIGMAERTVIIEDDCPLAVGVVGPLVFDRDGGDSVTFEISASGNIGPLVYQWFKRASSKAPGDIAVPGGTGPSLTLTDLENDDEGLYYCQVADAVTAVESPNFTLTVFVFVPATGLLGLGLASVVFAAAGGALARRRKG